MSDSQHSSGVEGLPARWRAKAGTGGMWAPPKYIYNACADELEAALVSRPVSQEAEVCTPEMFAAQQEEEAKSWALYSEGYAAGVVSRPVEHEPVFMEAAVEFFEAIVQQHGTNDHAWLVRNALEFLKEAAVSRPLHLQTNEEKEETKSLARTEDAG